jgi:hypothetical protein
MSNAAAKLLPRFKRQPLGQEQSIGLNAHTGVIFIKV